MARLGSFNCEAQGKGRAQGRHRKVTQRSFIDCRFLPPTILLLISRIRLIMDQVMWVEVRGGVQGQYWSPQGHCRSIQVTLGPLQVTVGHLRVTVSHYMSLYRSLQVTVGHCRVTRGDHRLNIGQFRLTPGQLICQLRVGKGYLMVTVGQQG